MKTCDARIQLGIFCLGVLMVFQGVAQEIPPSPPPLPKLPPQAYPPRIRRPLLQADGQPRPAAQVPVVQTNLSSPIFQSGPLFGGPVPAPPAQTAPQPIVVAPAQLSRLGC